MIESVNNGMVVLRPIAGIARQTKKISIGVESGASEPADYLYNPDLAEKINVSRESIKEEMGFLIQTKLGPRGEPDAQRALAHEKARFSSLDMLKRSLARIESLLYQVASVAASDPDSLEALQRKLLEELRDYTNVFERVELNEIVPPDLNLGNLDIGDKIDADKLNSNSFVASRESISLAINTIDRILEHAGIKKPEQSAAEAILSTADQNLAAAESTLYPQEIMSRAKEASMNVRDRILEAFGAQAHLLPEHVFKLTTNG